MEYPKNFPEDLQRPVDIAIAEAEAEFIEATDGRPLNIPEALWQYVVKIYFAFGDQVCQEMRDGVCSGYAARLQMEQFLHALLQRTYWEKNHGGSGSGESRDLFRTRTTGQIRSSKRWGDYQRSLAAALGEAVPVAHAAIQAQTPTRRGYREPILDWMNRSELSRVEDAAKRLALSKSALKSIMSSKGKPRYSQVTLERVLKEIGYEDEG